MTVSGARLTDELRAELAAVQVDSGPVEAVAWLSTVLRFAGQWTTIADRPVLEVAVAHHVLAHQIGTQVYRYTGQRARVLDTGRRGDGRFLVRIVDRPAIVARVTELVDRRGRPQVGLAPLVVGGSEAARVAAVRAAVCVAGSVSSPRRGVVTITCPTLAVGLAMRGLLRRAEVATKLRATDGDGVCRVDVAGDDVARLLAIVGAPSTAQRWTQARDLTAAQASEQRIGNFDSANAARAAVSAAVTAARVGRAFEILDDRVPEHLEAIARLRLEHPGVSLDELGRLADPPVSKDTAAGRLRRLLVLADKAALAAGVPDTYAAVAEDLRTA